MYVWVHFTVLFCQTGLWISELPRQTLFRIETSNFATKLYKQDHQNMWKFWENQDSLSICTWVYIQTISTPSNRSPWALMFEHTVTTCYDGMHRLLISKCTCCLLFNFLCTSIKQINIGIEWDTICIRYICTCKSFIQLRWHAVCRITSWC